MLFPAPPQNADDIRAFCARFNEGMRVEYKSTFDENVRRALPKVVSSFANSPGGVLIVGVNAGNGVPENPIEGFVTPRDELPLTVENICIQGTNPPIFPRTTVVNSDVAGRVFLVIEVDESWEAPHAIENSKKVYVRTGNAANPYDLAEVDLIIELVRRRAEPSALRERMLQRGRERSELAVRAGVIHTEVSLTPVYPRRTLCTLEDTWQFLSNQIYRGGHFFPYDTLRRVEDGTASFAQNQQYGQLNNFGVVLARTVMQPHDGLLLVGDPLHLLLKLLVCGNRFFSTVGYKGNVEMSLTLRNVQNQRLVFIQGVRIADLHEDDYRSYEIAVNGRQIVAAESLGRDLVQNVSSMISQVCWSFWQSADPFPANTIGEYVAGIVARMGRL